jgi:hypothetical protein
MPSMIPINEASVAKWLQKMQTMEKTTPNSIKKGWRALNFIGDKFGSFQPSTSTALRNRYEYLLDVLADIDEKPDKRAKPFKQSILQALEERARCAPKWVDRVGAATFRWIAGASPRYNDICHTKPSSFLRTKETVEFTAWQTKTKDKTAVHKPQPLIAAKVSFWEPELHTLKARKE